MNLKEFIISFLWLVSIDSVISSLIYLLYKYVNFKYFSKLEISTLIEENKYLKEQNQKLDGASTFWKKGDFYK